MEKAKKAEVVEDLNGVFAKAGSVVVAHYSGMTVAQMADLRSRMRANGASSSMTNVTRRVPVSFVRSSSTFPQFADADVLAELESTAGGFAAGAGGVT